MIKKSKYFITSYFQKSFNLLFPLISKERQEGIINTYLFAEQLDENILDYLLICEIKKGVELNKYLQRYLCSTYETDENTDVCIFDLNHISEEVDKFLSGNYSEYTEESKKDILRYNNWEKQIGRNKVVITVKDIKELKFDSNVHFYVFLYPDDFRKEVAEDMVKEYDLYDTVAEAVKTIKGIKELCPIYDLDKETLNKNIITYERNENSIS